MRTVLAAMIRTALLACLWMLSAQAQAQPRSFAIVQVDTIRGAITRDQAQAALASGWTGLDRCARALGEPEPDTIFWLDVEPSGRVRRARVATVMPRPRSAKVARFRACIAPRLGRLRFAAHAERSEVGIIVRVELGTPALRADP